MPVEQIVSIVLYSLLGIFAVFGFLFGLVKGFKKATLRLFIFLLFIALASLLSMPISKSVINIHATINGENLSFSEHLTKMLLNNETIANLYASSPNIAEFINVLPLLILNAIVFILLVLSMWFASYIVYLIISSIVFKRHKEPYRIKDGKNVIPTQKKEKKHRLLGGLVGVVQSLIMLFVILIPISGLVSTVSDLTYSTNDNVAYADDLTPTAKLLDENLPLEVKEVISAYNSNLVGKFVKMGGLDKLCFDTLTTVNVGGEKITLRREINAFANVYDNAAFLIDFDFSKTSLKSIDFLKLEKALDSLFNSGILKTLLPEITQWAVDDLTSPNPTLKIELPDFATSLLQALNSQLGKETNALNTIKTEVYAVFGVAKSACESGLADEIIKDEINLSSISNILLNNNRDALNKIVDNLMLSETLKNFAIIQLNAVLDKLEDKYELNIANVDFKKVDWDRTGIKDVLNSALDIYNNISSNISSDVFDSITKQPYLLFNADVDFICSKLSFLFNKLYSSSIFYNENGESIFPSILDALSKEEKISKYVDLQVFKNEGSIDTEFNLISNSLLAIKESNLINNLSDNISNEDISSILKKLANKDSSQKSYINKIVSNLLETSAFKKLIYLGFDEIDKLIENYQNQLGENVELGKIQKSAINKPEEKEKIVAFFDNVVLYASELNLEQLKSDAFGEIVASNLTRLGLALDSIKQSELFNSYMEDNIEYEGIYNSLIKALAKNPNLNEFADFLIALENDFSWNSELDKIQDAITAMNEIIVDENGQKTMLQAIKDGDNLDSIFESLTNEQVDRIINPLSQSQLMKKNIIKLVNTINTTLNSILNSSITKIPLDTDISMQVSDISNVIKNFISLYKEIKDGMTTEIIGTSYEIIGNTMNSLKSNALSTNYIGIFNKTYDAILDYLKNGEYGEKITYLLNNYTSQENVDWVDILALAVEAKDINENSVISDSLKTKLSVVVNSMYQDEDYGLIIADILTTSNNFVTLSSEANKLETLILLSDSLQTLSAYDSKINKVHNILDFIAGLIPTNKLEFLKVDSYLDEKASVDALKNCYQNFELNDSPEYNDYIELIENMNNSTLTKNLFLNNEITISVDSLYSDALKNYIQENYTELDQTNLLLIFGLN